MRNKLENDTLNGDLMNFILMVMVNVLDHINITIKMVIISVLENTNNTHMHTYTQLLSYNINMSSKFNIVTVNTVY